MTIVLGAREARQRFADLLGRVGYGGEVAIIERSGKPMVAVISIELYEQLVPEREARFRGSLGAVTGAQPRPPDGHTAQGCQAGQRAHTARRDAQAVRFRTRQKHGPQGHDGGVRDYRHTLVHGAGTDSRRAAR